MAPAKKRKRNSNGKQELMITVRMKQRTKDRLLEHCTKRGKKEGRTVSMNEAVIDLIHGASA